MPPLKNILKPEGEVVALIKPQFEAGKENVGKHGIVRDSKVHNEVINKVIGFAIDSGFSVLGLDFSPIKGGEGNVEFLIHLKSTEKPSINPNVSAKEVQDRAYKNLNN